MIILLVCVVLIFALLLAVKIFCSPQSYEHLALVHKVIDEEVAEKRENNG